MKLRFSLISIVAVGLFSACPRPHPEGGTLLCASGDRCPEGYECKLKPGTNDHACYEIGGDRLKDMSSGPDLSGSDAANRSTMCEELCACLNTTCDGVGATAGADSDVAACGTACLANMTQDLQCRWLHCTVFAKSATVPHCFHARGAGDPIVCQ